MPGVEAASDGAAADGAAAGGSVETPEWGLPVRGLLLDIDDTLVDTQAAMRHSCTVGAAAAWADESPELHRRISDIFYDDPATHFDAYTRGEQGFVQMRQARYSVATAALGLPDVGFEVFEGAYRVEFARSQRLFDDVHPMLAAAAEHGVRVCFLTNSGHEQTLVKLEQVGLDVATPVVTTDTLGFGKPDPRVFEYACAQIDVAPPHSIVVGDTLPTDVVGARNAGIRAAWLCRPGLPPPRGAGWGTPVADPGVRVVPTLHDVATLLAARGGRRVW